MTAQRSSRTPHAPKRAISRDALTGQRLQPDGLFLRVSSERLDNPPSRLDYQDGFRADEAPCPIRLHTPEVEFGGLGGHTFARQFARYLSSGLAAAHANAAYAQRAWWVDAYGRRRVLARFIRDDGPDAGALAYRVALAITSGYLSYDEVTAETRQNAKWVSTQAMRANIYAEEPAVRVVRMIERRRA